MTGEKIINARFLRGIQLLLLGIGAVLLIGVTCFCVFYIFTGYDELVLWYQHLGACFYKQQCWTSNFFTPLVRTKGNYYCGVALLIAVTGLILLFWNVSGKKKEIKSYMFYSSRFDFFAFIVLNAICFSLWQYGNAIARPCYDEVFSAQNVAGIHPFQAISYYMLPNNHIFFNLLNNLVLRNLSNGVIGGRLISFCCYVVFAWLSYFGCCRVVNNRIPGLFAAITLICQFFVWGFSFQARGYELYLLCEALLVVSMFAWVFSKDQKYLYWNIAAIAAGYYCMPSFLYLHVAQFVFVGIYQGINRDFSWSFWTSQAIGFGIVFMLYLPVLCFSGLDAITNNQYVAPMAHCKDAVDFSRWMFPNFNGYINHIFSDMEIGNFPVGLVLFIVPLCLLLARKNKMFFGLGVFYIVCWLTFFLIAIVMKRLPFERNLIGHYCITLCFFVIAIYLIISMIPKLPDVLKNGMFIAAMALLSMHLLQTNTSYLKNTLYEYDVNAVYDDLYKKLSVIPPGSSVGFSDEGFYCKFICQRKGFNVTKCNSGNEPYFLKMAGEAMPAGYQLNYKLLTTVNEYELYVRRE